MGKENKSQKEKRLKEEKIENKEEVKKNENKKEKPKEEIKEKEIIKDKKKEETVKEETKAKETSKGKKTETVTEPVIKKEANNEIKENAEQIQSEEVKEKSKKNKVSTVSMVLVVIVLIVALAYSAYRSLVNGNGLFNSAKIVVDVNVAEITKEIDENMSNKINTYYTVTVSNFEQKKNAGTGETKREESGTAFDYIIELETLDNSELPEYSWLDVATSEEEEPIKQLTGSFDNIQPTTKTYKICFYNTGNHEDITSNLNFKTTVIQKK